MTLVILKKLKSWQSKLLHIEKEADSAWQVSVLYSPVTIYCVDATIITEQYSAPSNMKYRSSSPNQKTLTLTIEDYADTKEYVASRASRFKKVESKDLSVTEKLEGFGDPMLAIEHEWPTRKQLQE